MRKKPERSKNRSHIRVIDPMHPDMAIVRQAAEAIRLGGVVVFPTTNLYGLGADATNADAVRRIFQIKGRSSNKPVSILINSRQDLNYLVAEIPSVAVKLMDAFWPGKLTIVFKARQEVLTELTAGTQKIGIRLPGHPVAKALLSEFGHPITATSANLSSMDGIYSIKDLPDEIADAVSYVLDAGTLKGGKGTTVVDATTDPPTVLREGEVSCHAIFDIGLKSD